MLDFEIPQNFTLIPAAIFPMVSSFVVGEPASALAGTQVVKRIKSKSGKASLLFRFVPRPGIEPGWVAPLVFETSASTDSAIWAIAQLRCKGSAFFVASKENVVFFEKKFYLLACYIKKK